MTVSRTRIGEADFEPRNTTVRLSMYQARAMFIRSLINLSRDTIDDLFRIANFQSFPEEIVNDPVLARWARCFLVEQARDPRGFYVRWPDIRFEQAITATPIHELSALIENNEGQYENLVGGSNRRLGSQPYIKEEDIEYDALSRMIPDWTALQKLESSRPLCEQIMAWASKWGLTNEWCLTCAVQSLVEFKSMHLDTQMISRKAPEQQEMLDVLDWYIDEWSWQSWINMTRSINIDRFAELVRSLPSMPELPHFRFEWTGLDGEKGFEIEQYFPPYSISWPEFSKRVSLEFWQAFHRHFETRLGAAYTDLDLVFANEIGKPIHYRNLTQRHYEKILEAINLHEKGSVLYSLRHTCATLLLAASENPKVVSERLGHSTVRMTLDTYSHVLPDMQRSSTEKLGRMIYG